MTPRSVLVLLAVAAAGASAVPAAAADRVIRCSETGDSCQELLVRGDRVIARQISAERYRARYRVCVTTPVRRVCAVRPVRALGNIWAAELAVPRRTGVYRMGDFAPISLRVRAAVRGSRVCAPVPAPPAQPSTVRAVNIACGPARRLVRLTTERGRRAPAGWVYVNPAGCEGFIVPRADVERFVRGGYRALPGRPMVASTIDRGCRS